MVRRNWEWLKKIFECTVTRRLSVLNGGVQPGLRHSNASETAEQGESGLKHLHSGDGLMTVTAAQHTPSPVTSHSFTSGQMLAGRFRIVRFISSGGMGEVFEAADSELGERVALKTIRPDIASYPSVIDRFKQEVRQPALFRMSMFVAFMKCSAM
jgi:hypothetical protein